MSINKDKHHIYIIPEDDRNKQIANGFKLAIGGNKIFRSNQISVRNSAKGWPGARDECKRVSTKFFPKYELSHIIILVDFDKNYEKRIFDIKKELDEKNLNRIYIFGCHDEAETLKRSVSGSYEEIGKRIFAACEDGGGDIMDTSEMNCNREECERIKTVLSKLKIA